MRRPIFLLNIVFFLGLSICLGFFSLGFHSGAVRFLDFCCRFPRNLAERKVPEQVRRLQQIMAKASQPGKRFLPLTSSCNHRKGLLLARP